MSLFPTGDLSQHFQSLQQTKSIKGKLLTLSNEMTTGKKSDVASALNGDLTRLLVVDREIATMGEYKNAANEAVQVMALMQSSLEAVDSIRGNQSEIALAISDAAARPVAETTARAAKSAFQEMTNLLNRRYGSQSLFAGVATERNAVESAQFMIDEIVATLPPAPMAQDISDAVDTWFSDPLSGFSTDGFLGDDRPASKPIGQGQSISMVATAESEGIKSVLKATALGAVAFEMASGLSTEDLISLVKESGLDLLASSDPLNALRGEIGISEGRGAEKIAEYDAQITSFSIVRNEMTSADPYDTAVKLQEVQQQLEMQFAITAKLSNLSLVNYI